MATARPVWQLLADAQVAVYPSVTAAARALSYCRHYQITKELLPQTPTLAQIEVESRSVRAVLDDHVAAGQLQLSGEVVDRILRHYGLANAAATPEATVALRVHCCLHPQLGMVMELRPEAGEMRAATAVALPPLDDCLARSVLEEAGFDGPDQPQLSGLRHRAAPVLIRIAELLVDQEGIEEIDLRLRTDGDTLSVVPGGLIRLAAVALPSRRRLALAPYPVHLDHRFADTDDAAFRYRAVLPTDEAALIALLSKIPADDIRLRFFTYIREFTHAMAARMTQVDYDRELSIIAMPVGHPDEVIAIATLIADTDGSTAEFAILVHQNYRFKGIARHLMECLLERARAKGIGKVFGEVLRENSGMRQLARSLGFVERTSDAQTVHVEWSQPPPCR